MSDETNVTTTEAAAPKAPRKRAAKKASPKAKAKKATKAKAAANGKPKAKREGLSQFAAALQVLKGRTKGLTVGEIYDAITTRKLWLPLAGATPKATLSAALQREAAKGKDARVKKAGPGVFILRK